jgi:hypothetical protein
MEVIQLPEPSNRRAAVMRFVRCVVTAALVSLIAWQLTATSLPGSSALEASSSTAATSCAAATASMPSDTRTARGSVERVPVTVATPLRT